MGKMIGEIKKFLKKKGIKFQEYEISEGTCKKDTSRIEYLKYIMSQNDKSKEI